MWHDWLEQDKLYFMFVYLIIGFILIAFLDQNNKHGDPQIKSNSYKTIICKTYELVSKLSK